ncbi:MAG: 4Fe-4S dicluster domain-containing protein [Promethearchaeota archaeon]|nr:MAG: 4Fe-4S dicluster domain-containing protein [Candidatus Lokiarchaeota archaeon]
MVDLNTSHTSKSDPKEKISIDLRKCMGCGSCVTACPNGGFKVINGKARVIKKDFCDGLGFCIQNCPMGAILYNGQPVGNVSKLIQQETFIRNWPIKLHIVKENHSQFNNANLAIVADCVPAIFRSFNEIAQNHTILLICPKIESPKEIREKLISIINENTIQSVCSYNVDYICCDSLPRIVKDAIRFSKKSEDLMANYKHHVICLFGSSK